MPAYWTSGQPAGQGVPAGIVWTRPLGARHAAAKARPLWAVRCVLAAAAAEPAVGICPTEVPAPLQAGSARIRSTAKRRKLFVVNTVTPKKASGCYEKSIARINLQG